MASTEAVDITSEGGLHNSSLSTSRMGGRVVYCTGLENRRPRKGSVGSNPTPSAIILVLPNKSWILGEGSYFAYSAKPARRAMLALLVENGGQHLNA
jgi:hypothetical protein